MLIFDTSAIIEALKENKKLEKYLEENIAISTITVHELLYGALKRGMHERKLVEMVLGSTTIIELNLEIAIASAQIKKDLEGKGKTVNLADAVVAATAQIEGIRLVTFDKDFEGIQKETGIDIEIIEKK